MWRQAVMAEAVTSDYEGLSIGESLPSRYCLGPTLQRNA